MKLKHLFILSLAAVPGGALAADPQVDIKTNVGTIRLRRPRQSRTSCST
jgi:hypothetical protein